MAFQTTLNTMIVFFLILSVGFVAGKLNVIKEDFMGGFAQLITKIFLPVLIFYNMATGVTRQMLFDNLWMIPASAILFATLAAAALLVAKLLRLPHDKDRIFQLSFIFGNTGFVGFPLLGAVFPGTGILFMCMFSIVENLAFWTYGVWLATARDRSTQKFSIKKVFTLNVIAILLAFAFCLSGLTLPSVLESTLGTISKSSSALCMIYLGATICFSHVGQCLKRPDVYVNIVAKMVIMAIIAGLTARALDLPEDIVGCFVLYVALPVMTITPMIATQNGHEGEYATGIAVVSFVACVLTIPLVAFIML